MTCKKLYQEADNRCPFCGVADVAVLEIHHFRKIFFLPLAPVVSCVIF
jgi:hypothetical protein